MKAWRTRAAGLVAAAIAVGGACRREAPPAGPRCPIDGLVAALDAYRATCGHFPGSLTSLVAPGVTCMSPGPFMRTNGPVALHGVFRDLWGTPYQYRTTDTGYVLQSAGPDRAFGTADDVVRVGSAGPAKAPRPRPVAGRGAGTR